MVSGLGPKRCFPHHAESRASFGERSLSRARRRAVFDEIVKRHRLRVAAAAARDSSTGGGQRSWRARVACIEKRAFILGSF